MVLGRVGGLIGGLVGSVDRLGGIGRLLLGVLGLALVGHISDQARVGISNSVGHSLDAAIGKSNTVRARGSIAVTVLLLVEVNASIVVLDSVVVVVDRGSSGFLILGLVRGPGVLRGLVRGGLVGRRGGLVGKSDSSKGKDDKGLKKKIFCFSTTY